MINDIFLIRNEIFMLKSVKSSLSQVYSIKELGKATYILGILIYDMDRSDS